MTTFDEVVTMRRTDRGWRHVLDGSRSNLLGVPYGGYLMAVVLEAMARETPDRSMLSVTCQFTRVLEPGPVEVVVDDVRVGRNVATKTAQLLGPDDRLGLHATVLFGRPPTGPVVWTDEPPVLPPVEQCVDPFAESGTKLDFTWPAAVLTHPSVVDAVRAGDRDRPEVVAWSGMLDDQPLSGPRFAMMADKFVPPPWLLGQMVALRTLQLSFHLHRPQHVGWLRTRYRTPVITEDLVTLESTYWDDEGRVVAIARQLAQPVPVDATF